MSRLLEAELLLELRGAVHLLGATRSFGALVGMARRAEEARERLWEIEALLGEVDGGAAAAWLSSCWSHEETLERLGELSELAEDAAALVSCLREAEVVMASIDEALEEQDDLG